jgi:hypothetical protein
MMVGSLVERLLRGSGRLSSHALGIGGILVAQRGGLVTVHRTGQGFLADVQHEVGGVGLDTI